MSRRLLVLESAVNTVLVVAIVAVLVVVVLGLFSDHEPALYLTAVVLGLLFAALQLLFPVYAHRGPARTSAEAEQPAS
jgi:hypothetical protein